MVQKHVIVKNKAGLTARPAAVFVQAASKYSCEVFLEKNGVRVSGKSIMGIMSLGIDRGTKVIVTACGKDEIEAADDLSGLLSWDIPDMVKYI